MKTVNFDDFKCRCSKIDTLFAIPPACKPLTPNQQAELEKLESKSSLTTTQEETLKKLIAKRDTPAEIPMSAGVIEYLMEWYAWEVYDKKPVDKESMEMIPTEKGKKVEAASIILLSKVDGKLYQKNEQRVENEFLCGEPDVYEGEDIMSATTVTDMKNALDYPKFLKQINLPLENKYIKQIKGYGDITGARDLSITRTLVSFPDEMIMDYQDRIARKLCVIDRDTASFQETWEEWEKSMLFDDIPMRLRVYKTKVEPFTTEEQIFLYDRVKYCRDWLWKFHENYSKL